MFRNSCMTTVLLTVLFLGVVNAQSTITIYSSGVNSIVRYKDAQNQNTFQYTSLYQIGRKDGSNGYYSGSTEDIYRSQHSFSLGGIPSNATLSQVKLIYFVSGSSSYKFMVTQTSGSQSWGNLWGEIGTASALESDINYGSSSRISSSLLSAVNSARSSGVIYLGALSQNESTNLTEATVELRFEVTYTVPPAQVNITAQNNFGGGTIKVGVNASATQRTSPYPFTPTVGNTVNLEAQEQNYDNYYRIWNDTEAPVGPSKWLKYASGIQTEKSTSISYSFTAADNDNSSTYEAGLRKVCNATFQSAGGTVYLDGTHSSPYTVQVVEQNSVTATADNYYDQGLYYRFKGWNGSNSSTVTLYETSTYTASYTREPSLLGMDFTLVSGIGSNPTLTWNEHQSTDVTKYRIYRTIKNIETDVLIAELNRGTTTYTDYSRIITNNDATNNLTFYRLRVVLTPENLESEEWGQTCYTTVDMKLAGNDNNITTVKTEVPEDFSISSYPNPFNPTTTINYQLPENSYVTIKVYDILGKEIATLVNESKNAGFHNVNFDASRLTSGIYIYTINAGKYIQSKKMLLTK